MKLYLTSFVLFTFFLWSCKSESGQGGSGIDSMQIARIMVEKYPDSICKRGDSMLLKGLNLNGRPVEWKSTFSDRIKEADARAEHINYLHKYGLQNSAYTIIHSLFIKKDHLKTVYDNCEKGARLSFSYNEYDGKNYIGIIMVPLDASGRNKLGTDADPIMVNRLEPCPNSCPESPQDLNESDLNYNKDGVIDAKYQGLWLMPNKRGWVDQQGVVKYPL